ncbi:MAG: hypothetical protein C5B55_12175 [Blastocatellia bacterium]|nr:MAG: hypothetical protein C5B55_12175 [Blastocatellia bacterium]
MASPIGESGTTTSMGTRIRSGRITVQSKESEPAHNESSSLGVVYVNDAGRNYVNSGITGPFPVGSVIVREKPSLLGIARPELLAVMIKREQGFNPGAGDWLFLTVTGDGNKLLSQQKRGACFDCHQSQRKSDFVYPLTHVR